jgi:hypothetical protein
MSMATNKLATIEDTMCGKHMLTAMNERTTVEEPLEVVSSTWSMPRLYNEDQQQ